MNTDIVWSNLLNELKDELSSLAYSTWFSDTKLEKLDNGTAIIIVPMPIHKRHLNDVYGDKIISKLNKLTNSSYNLKFLLQEEYEVENVESVVDKDIKTDDSPIINNDNINNNLIKKYTFENFIVGNSNKFATTAALSVAENPGNMYNPLFLYGNSGLGKTHLMHAIGNYIVENSNKKVLYITSEQFKDDFTKVYKKDDNGTNFNYVEFFKNKYRNIDVLIIDDIQFLGGATKTQEEFFHTFNNLYNNNKQIIISSDRSPNDLKLLLAPFYMALPAVSAILIGGATVNKATIPNVIIGTFLFQGIVTMTPTVMNSMIHMDMSEVIRVVVSQGMILYALTRRTEAAK